MRDGNGNSREAKTKDLLFFLPLKTQITLLLETKYIFIQNWIKIKINSQKEEWILQRSASNPIVAKPSSVLNYFSTHNEIISEFIDIINKKIRSNESGTIVFNKFQSELKFVTLESSIFTFRYLLVSFKKFYSYLLKWWVL